MRYFNYLFFLFSFSSEVIDGDLSKINFFKFVKGVSKKSVNKTAATIVMKNSLRLICKKQIRLIEEVSVNLISAYYRMISIL